MGDLQRSRNSRGSISGAWERNGDAAVRPQVQWAGGGCRVQVEVIMPRVHVRPHGALGGHKQSHLQRHNMKFGREICLASGRTRQCQSLYLPAPGCYKHTAGTLFKRELLSLHLVAGVPVAQTLGISLLRLAKRFRDSLFAAESRPKLLINAALRMPVQSLLRRLEDSRRCASFQIVAGWDRAAGVCLASELFRIPGPLKPYEVYLVGA